MTSKLVKFDGIKLNYIGIYILINHFVVYNFLFKTTIYCCHEITQKNKSFYLQIYKATLFSLMYRIMYKICGSQHWRLQV